MSAGWIEELNREDNEEHHHHDVDEDEEHEEEHEHHHGHHHHHHDEGETEEYGIGTFVYYKRSPFNRDKFDKFAVDFPSNIIRCKGVLWFSDEPESSYVFEQSGKQVQAFCAGEWVASFNPEEQKQIIAQNPDIKKSWDEKYGDRTVKLVFIGRNMDKEGIIEKLNNCIDE